MLNVSYSEFVELRRKSLERFLTRIAEHHSLRLDPHFREFLELDVILPKSRNTQSLSGNNIRRMINAWNDGIKTVRMVENDQWFVEKSDQIVKIESQLLKLQVIAETMVEQKKNLAQQSRLLSKDLVMLSKAENNKETHHQNILFLSSMSSQN